MADDGTITIVYNGFPALTKLAQAAVARVVQDTAKAGEREIKVSMNTPKHGRTYQKGDVVRRARKGELAGFAMQFAMRPGFVRSTGGLRVKQSGAGYNVVIGAALHRASAPGEAPAIDTSALSNSIRCERETQLTWNIVVGQADVGRRLEYGTRYMAPRPYLRPMADHVRPVFIQDVTRAIQDSASQASMAAGH